MPKYRAPYDTQIINPYVDSTYAIADEYVPKLVRAWRKGVRGVAKAAYRVVLDSLTEIYYAPPAITAVDSSPLMAEAYSDMRATIEPKLIDLWVDAEIETRRLSAKGVPEVQDAAIRFAENQSAEMVTGIADGQRAAIREIITEGVEGGIHPRVIASDIRDLGIGLAEKGPHTYGRVERYRRAQEEAGVTGKKLEARVQRFYDKTLLERARAIAATETVSTQSAARNAIWSKDLESGLIPPDTARVWIAGVVRTCPQCAALDGQTAPLGEPYEDGTMSPPAHPRCRCTEIIRF
jgi:hypothetical protein